MIFAQNQRINVNIRLNYHGSRKHLLI